MAKRVQPEATRISFRAKGFVPKVIKLDADTDPGPLHVVLETGRSLHLRVVDQAGQPLPKARVVADLPSTVPAVLASTDAEGKATIQVGQTEPLEHRVEAAGFKPASVAAPSTDGEERTIALAREAGVAVSGAVTDATTGQPVPAFRAVCGTFFLTGPFPTNGTFEPSRFSEDWFKFGGGKFRLEPGHFLGVYSDAKRSGFALKFEADGYAPVLSRVIQADEGELQLDVALVPAQTIQVTVLNPNGRPATDAEVGLVQSMIGIHITREHHLSITLGAGLLRPDAQGVFALPPDDSIKRVIAINSWGFAAASPAALAREPILQLQPFGRVEGQWLRANQPAAGREVTLGIDGGGYVLDCSATTDSEGRFAIPQVPPGKYWVMSNARGQDGSYTSHQLAEVEVRPGEISTVTSGGYVVNVRVRWAPDLAPGNGTRVGVWMQTPAPEPPPAITRDPQALTQWSMLPEVQAQLQAVRRCDFVEGADGSWTAEGVQAGVSYMLEAVAAAEGGTNGSPPIGWGRMPVTIPAEPAMGSIDAGEVVLQSVKP